MTAHQDFKSELRRIVIAALLGACVTFFTNLVQGLTEIGTPLLDNVAGGASASATYLKMALSGGTRVL